MSPLTLAQLENQVSTVKKYLGMLDAFRPYSWEKIASDIFLRGSYERYVYLLLQSTLDLAETVVALRKYRKPSSYGETFDILLENKIIEPELAEALRRLARLRNAMTHDYEYLKPERLFDVLTQGCETVQVFLGIVETTVL